ncbi:Ferric/cupric reductase transmembrane component [Drechslerella dactyloides]|uniref:Ferric/cupric reductase transmembrane component n=1 Tax=Drechslerella dactyloides TaxID=74499 RepID=A0AAD6NIN9_DREDA|nr:Ferric/cupric reductase transmembrane component [Drechslerella dactyloides]
MNKILFKSEKPIRPKTEHSLRFTKAEKSMKPTETEKSQRPEKIMEETTIAPEPLKTEGNSAAATAEEPTKEINSDDPVDWRKELSTAIRRIQDLVPTVKEQQDSCERYNRGLKHLCKLYRKLEDRIQRLELAAQEAATSSAQLPQDSETEPEPEPESQPDTVLYEGNPQASFFAKFSKALKLLLFAFSLPLKKVAQSSTANSGGESAIIEALHLGRRLGIYYNVAVVLFPLGTFVVRKAAARVRAWRKVSKARRKEKRKQVANGSADVSMDRNRHADRAGSVGDLVNVRMGKAEAFAEVSPSGESSPSSSSSSSSELEVAVGESTPLLAINAEEKIAAEVRIPWYTLLYRRLKGILTYQRANDHHGRTAPATGISIVNTLYFFTTVSLCVYGIYISPAAGITPNLKTFLLADRFGQLFAANQPLNYLLAAKTSPVRVLTGWSYERHLVFHMAVSVMCFYLSIFHFFWMWRVHRIFSAPSGASFLSLLLHPQITAGLAAFASFAFFSILSHDDIRARSYEFFLATHIIFSAVAMAALYFHHPAAKGYVILSLAIWLIDRVVYRAYWKRVTADATIAVVDESTVRVTVKDVRTRGAGASTWKPGEHVFLTVPGWSRLQAHPFTILSPPAGYDLDPSSVENGGKDMVLVIRRLKGFTEGLYGMAATASTTQTMHAEVVIDGPYGNDHARDAIRGCRKAIFVAGGSGIAAVWPLMCEVVRRHMDRAARGRAGKHARTVTFLWIVQYPHHVNWLEDLPQLEEAKRVLASVDVDVDVRIFITKGPEGKRPDLREEIRKVVDGNIAGRTGVVVCGPDAMVRDVRNAGFEMLWKGKDVEIVTEKFTW